MNSIRLQNNKGTDPVENPYSELPHDRISQQLGLDNATVINGEFYPHNLNKIESSSRVIHLEPLPKDFETSLQNEASGEETQSKNQPINLEVYGKGDYILKEAFISYLEWLNKRKTVDNVTLSEIEINSMTFNKFLSPLEQKLRAFHISRVPLDDAHRAMLNAYKFSKLQCLSLAFIESDQSHAFQEQKKDEIEKPFNVSRLDFKSFCPNIKFLQLKGITLEKETFNTILETFSDSLEILNIEMVKGITTELTSYILQNLRSFRNLVAFSLAYNKLDMIDFLEVKKETERKEQEENSNPKYKILFPQNLKALNLNGCNLNDKQVNNLIEVLSESKCPLEALHLEGSYLYERTLEAIDDFVKISCTTAIFRLEISRLIDANGRSIFKNAKPKNHAIEIKIHDDFTELLETSADIEALKSMQNSTKKPEWISQLSGQSDSDQTLPYYFKALRETKFVNDAYRHGFVDFSTNTRIMIPKHDFNELLSKIASEMNGTLLIGDTSLAGVYVKLMRQVDAELLRDKYWVSLTLKEQRDKFLELMKKLGYQHIEKKHKDCFEDVFVMAIKTLKKVSYDYTLATFSLFWYYNQVSLKFNLSDDWYLDRKRRVNRYAIPNQDFLISFCSEWNIHTNDYVFVLDIKKEGEPEVIFKSDIWKDGDLNVSRALLIAIDKGFVMLKALHKIELFDKGDIFKGVEDSKKVRKILKEKLKKYANSQDFENLRKEEIEFEKQCAKKNMREEEMESEIKDAEEEQQ